MSRIIENATHAAEWMAQAPENSALEVVDAFERGVNMVWRCCRTMVGEATLYAVLKQVVLDAVHLYPVMASVVVDRQNGLNARALRRDATGPDLDQLRDGARYVLTRLLDVVGFLTSDDSAPALRTALTDLHRPPRRLRIT